MQWRNPLKRYSTKNDKHALKKMECSILGKGCTKRSVSCQYDSYDELITKKKTQVILL